jgi:hypothetical protein
VSGPSSLNRVVNRGRTISSLLQAEAGGGSQNVRRSSRRLAEEDGSDVETRRGNDGGKSGG